MVLALLEKSEDYPSPAVSPRDVLMCGALAERDGAFAFAGDVCTRAKELHGRRAQGRILVPARRLEQGAEFYGRVTADEIQTRRRAGLGQATARLWTSTLGLRPNAIQLSGWEKAERLVPILGVSSSVPTGTRLWRLDPISAARGS